MSDPEAEVKVLVEEIQRLGEQLESGKYAVKYGGCMSNVNIRWLDSCCMLVSAQQQAVHAYNPVY
jgi:hypothetical protein